MDSDQMAALSGTIEFSYLMNISMHPLNLHNTLKNISRWHLGKYCWHHGHTALGLSFHSDFCGSCVYPLSFSAQGLSLASRSYCAWLDFLRVICNQWGINTPAFSPLTWEYPESSSGIKSPLPTVVIGLKTHLLLTAFPVSFLMIFSEVPFCINSNKFSPVLLWGSPYFLLPHSWSFLLNWQEGN